MQVKSTLKTHKSKSYKQTKVMYKLKAVKKIKQGIIKLDGTEQGGTASAQNLNIITTIASRQDAKIVFILFTGKSLGLLIQYSLINCDAHIPYIL